MRVVNQLTGKVYVILDQSSDQAKERLIAQLHPCKELQTDWSTGQAKYFIFDAAAEATATVLPFSSKKSGKGNKPKKAGG